MDGSVIVDSAGVQVVGADPGEQAYDVVDAAIGDPVLVSGLTERLGMHVAVGPPLGHLLPDLLHAVGGVQELHFVGLVVHVVPLIQRLLAVVADAVAAGQLLLEAGDVLGRLVDTPLVVGVAVAVGILGLEGLQHSGELIDAGGDFQTQVVQPVLVDVVTQVGLRQVGHDPRHGVDAAVRHGDGSHTALDALQQGFQIGGVLIHVGSQVHEGALAAVPVQLIGSEGDLPEGVGHVVRGEEQGLLLGHSGGGDLHPVDVDAGHGLILFPDPPLVHGRVHVAGSVAGDGEGGGAAGLGDLRGLPGFGGGLVGRGSLGSRAALRATSGAASVVAPAAAREHGKCQRGCHQGSQ